MIQFWQPGQPGWYDGFWLDAEGNRVRYDPQKTELNGQSYVPLTSDPRFANAGTPQSYLSDPTYADALANVPGAFVQGPDGQWYMSEQAQGEASKVMHRSNQFIDGLLTNMPQILGGIATGAALGGAFPGIDAIGNAIPAGQSGILSQLGIQNPLSKFFSPEGTGSQPSNFLNNSVADAGTTASDAGPQFTMQDINNALNNGGPVSGGPTFTMEQINAALNPYAGSMTMAPEFIGAQTAAGAGLGATTVGELLTKLGAKATDAAASTALGRLLQGQATTDDYAKLIGAAGSAGLGLLGSNAQTNAFNNVADKYLSLGQPFRDKLLSSYDPGFDISKSDPSYAGALDQASKSVLRGLSTSGNPADNPGAMSEAMKYVTSSTALPYLNAYRSQLASAGGLGVNTAGTGSLGAAQSAGGAYDALGYGLSQVTGNQNDLASILGKYPGILNNSYSLLSPGRSTF